MAFSVAAFGTAAAVAAGAILKFESENVLNDGPSALLNPDPPGAIPSVAQAIARQTCRRYADGVPGLDEKTAVDLETVCRPYLDNIGYGSGPKLLKPFEGGQCPGVRYELSGRRIDGAGLVISSWTSTCGSVRNGPITPRTFVDGSTRRMGYDYSTNSGERRFAEVWTSGPTSNARITIDSIARCDGQPDSCGDPPPDFTEPVPPPNPGPPVEPFNPGPDIDINIEVNLRPDSLIEVNFGLGPIVVPVFGGEDGDGGGGDPGGEPEPGGGGAPGTPEGGPELPGGNGGFGGDDAFGPDPAGRRWIGACIRITQRPDNSGIISGTQPEDVYPNVVGNCRLVYDAFGTRVVDTPVQIRAKGVCLWEPVRGMNPVAVNVDLLPGFGYTYKPYSVPLDN